MLPPLSQGQKDMIDFGLDRDYSAWLVPPGYGKTRAWLEYIAATRGRTLVLAPKLVCSNVWPREWRKWEFENEFDMTFLHGEQKRLDNLPDVCLMNYEAIPWLVGEIKALRKFPFESVIYDELSKLKNPESKRATAWMKVFKRFAYRNGGTGTPVGAHLKDLFGEMLVCDGGESLGNDYEMFIRKHFYEDPYTKIIDPYHDAKEEILSKMDGRAISFDINDLDMPPLVHKPVMIELPKKVREFYELMHKENAVEELDLTAVNAAVRSGKLRQIASGGVLDDIGERKFLHSAKANMLKDIVDEYQGEPVMVFFEFLSDYISICDALGYEVPALYGKTRTKDANTYIARWNAGRLPVFALHPRSAAYGLNLQDSGHVIVWYTVPWSYEMINQGIARLWRQGQKNRVIAHYLLVEDSIDEQVYGRVKERESLHDEVMMRFRRDD